MQNYTNLLIGKANSLPESEVKGFLLAFIYLRDMVVACSREIPEEKLDYAPSLEKGTHRLLDCIAELPVVEKQFIDGYRTGHRKMFNGISEMFNTEKPTKQEILDTFQKTDEELFELLTSPTFDPTKEIEFAGKDGQVKKKMTAMWMLWGLRNHENLHLGMIRRDLDAVGVKPPFEYIKYWYLE